ncbi:MAG: serine hydrolase domain-containing protein [Vicinamibacterales bacterium]
MPATTPLRSLVAVALFATACGGSPPPPPPAESAPPPPVALASLDPADLEAFVADVAERQHAVGVTVGVMRDGQVIFAKGYGKARLDGDMPVATDTLFAVGSVTKQFTCAVALQLEQEGRLSFDDRVAKYEPTLTRAKDITVRDIAGMVSGYHDYYPLDFVDRPMAAPRPSLDIVRDFASRRLDFEPRSRYSYSNTGYLLLGRIIEMAGREPYAAALQRRLLTPLGLEHTRFEPTRGGSGMAEGYTPMALGAPEPAIPEGDGWIGAAGGLWSTPTDLLAWDLALMDGRVLSPASWTTMSRPRTLTDGRTSGYGCGQSIRDRGPTLVLEHGGAVSGFGARNALVPSSRSAVVVMANADWAGGVLDAIEGAVLAKLMPAADAPVVAGSTAREAAIEMLSQVRRGDVDRALLGEEYDAFLTPARLKAMSASLAAAGEITDLQAGPIRERGGMEVSTLTFRAGDTAASALMYRTPDGKIQEFLVSRR